jgi:hypothetical protein
MSWMREEDSLVGHWFRDVENDARSVCGYSADDVVDPSGECVPCLRCYLFVVEGRH